MSDALVRAPSHVPALRAALLTPTYVITLVFQDDDERKVSTVNPYVNLAVALLSRSVQDVQAGNAYAVSALRFLKSDWAEYLAFCCGIDVDCYRQHVRNAVKKTLATTASTQADRKGA